MFSALCIAAGLPQPVAEYPFAPPRKWRFDWAWPNASGGGVALEVEGGAWTGGRHTRGKGFENDIEKYAEAVCRGWILLRVTPKMMSNGSALLYLQRIFDGMGSQDKPVAN